MIIFFTAEYPYINYFVIHKTRDEATAVFTEARARTYDAFSPEKTGFGCGHTYDKYDEVATIARPPIEPISRKPIADTTGYIVCMYRVFKGDDGQKFERNWLYWTGILKRNVFLYSHATSAFSHSFFGFLDKS